MGYEPHTASSVLNTESNDVTIVDAETNLAVNKIGIGGNANRLELLPGGDYVAVTTGKDTLHLIDVATNQKVRQLEYGGNFVLSPDGKHALGRQGNSVLPEGSQPRHGGFRGALGNTADRNVFFVTAAGRNQYPRCRCGL